MNNQKEAPLLAAMQRYVEAVPLPFHTPGHKQGKGSHPLLMQMIGQQALAMDVSLISELDDLHAPRTCIKEAQNLAAALYEADHSYFVINGTTGGIHAMILAVAGPGEKILLPRNVHRSVIGGIILSGAQPVYMQPEMDRELGLAMGITPETAEKTICQHPDAKALLLINPTYYGVAADIGKIIEIAHSHGLIVIVDEAHGPHFKFHGRLPAQALDAGADIVVQSTHKLLGAMTQCSMVHCREGRVNVARLETMLRLLQSTSPNYLLLASLDIARMQMAAEGKILLEKAILSADWLRKQINDIPGLYCFGEEKLGNPGMYRLDPTKITVTVSGLGLTGAQAEQILRYQYKIQAELSDMYNVLFLLTIGDGETEARALLSALRGLAVNHCGKEDFFAVRQAAAAAAPPIPEEIFLPQSALFGNTREVLFERSADMVCAEIVTFYPPGIPLLCPGERISEEMIGYCRRLQAGGLIVSGPDDPALTRIKVMC